ncbi:MAG: stalk domain-containing protein, partial [Fervidobacterium sp.]
LIHVFNLDTGQDEWSVELSEKYYLLGVIDGVIYALYSSGGKKHIVSIKKQQIIEASSDSNGSISPSGSVAVIYNALQPFEIAPNAGFKIKDVKVDGVSVGAVSTYTFENVTQDHTIEAVFEPITYSVTASSGLGGSISPSGNVTVNYGESKTFMIMPNSGYKISNVKVDGVSKGSISLYTFTNITSDHTISATFEKQITQTVIILQIGNSTFTVNGSTRTLDSPPIIKNSRTLLPIRAVVEALDGTIEWDATTKKVTVSLGYKTIELWIGKPIAKVNGIDTQIDSTNPKVVPEIINGRTMLPLRFVAESLGCDVQWDGTTKTITITYPKY